MNIFGIFKNDGVPPVAPPVQFLDQLSSIKHDYGKREQEKRAKQRESDMRTVESIFPAEFAKVLEGIRDSVQRGYSSYRYMRVDIPEAVLCNPYFSDDLNEESIGEGFVSKFGKNKRVQIRLAREIRKKLETEYKMRVSENYSLADFIFWDIRVPI